MIPGARIHRFAHGKHFQVLILIRKLADTFPCASQ